MRRKLRDIAITIAEALEKTEVAVSAENGLRVFKPSTFV